MFNDHMNSTFKWFVGIVEDRDDPDELGRVKCRCFGVHPSDKTKCTTDDLPWATVMSSTANANVRGVRSTVHGLVVGSVVVGFFMDGDSAQYPLVMGTIPGRAPEKKPNPDKTYNTDAQVWNFTSKEPDINKLSTSVDVDAVHPMVKQMAASKVSLVNCASAPDLSKVDGTQRAASYFSTPKWTQPDGRGGSERGEFPWTKSEETDYGHVLEVDDSRDNPRLLWYHGDGTYEEYLSGGHRVCKVVGNNYEVTFGSNNILVRGNANFTVEGDCRHLVTGSYHVEVLGDYTEKIHGSKKVKITGNDLSEVNGYQAVMIGADKQLTVNGKIKDIAANGIRQTISGDYSITVGGLAPAFDLSVGTLPGLGLIQMKSTGQLDLIASLGAGIKGATTTLGDPATVTNIVGSVIGVSTVGALGVGVGGAIVLAAGASISQVAPAITLN
jgi:hypothetical protein